MGMAGVSGPGMNGMVSMAPQQAMNPGMMGAAPGMVMAGGMGGMNSYGGMQMSSAGMVGGMGAMAPMNSMGQVAQMGHMGMGNMALGMGGMPPGGGFADMNQPMWNQGWGA
jgi:hypothetical protein